MDYQAMAVPELRKEASARGIGSGAWRVGASKADLVSALQTGEVSGFTVRGTAPAPAAATAGGLEALIAAAVAPFIQAPAISQEEFSAMAELALEQSEKIQALEKMLADVLDKIASGDVGGGASVNVSFTAPLPGVRVEGLAHRQFGQVLAWVAAGVPLWLWGGAGCGKTHLARQVGAALGLPVTVVSIDPTMTVGKLLGFRSLATGEFIPGFLLAPYRDGGVVCLDEVDTGDAGILASLNALLANGHFLFPDGTEVARHPNFRVLAGANTKGLGAVAGYTARTRLDAATLDRFAVVELKPDNGLELALCCGGRSESVPWQGGEPLTAEQAAEVCPRWVRWVQAVRAKVGASVLVSPRASLLGCAALRAGIPAAEVADALVFKLASPDTRENILRECGPVPSVA